MTLCGLIETSKDIDQVHGSVLGVGVIVTYCMAAASLAEVASHGAIPSDGHLHANIIQERIVKLRAIPQPLLQKATALVSHHYGPLFIDLLFSSLYSYNARWCVC